jgi:glycosyltransferase involved in cell wall biosynthesis
MAASLYRDFAFWSERPARPEVASLIRDHRISVVIPTLNEAKNLPYVLPRIPEWVDEVLIVDGLSTDGTSDVARAICPRVTIVEQTGRGKGAALQSGFAAATGDIIVMLDADGSTDPAEIPAFVGPLLAGADFVKGSRFIQGGGSADISPMRRLGNWTFVELARCLHGGRYSDLCYGYNAFWSWVVPVLNLECQGFEVETVMNIRALRAGLKVVEVPSFEAPRLHGMSNLRTLPDGWRVTKAIFRETRAGLHGSTRKRAADARTVSVRASFGYAQPWSSAVELPTVVTS